MRIDSYMPKIPPRRGDSRRGAGLAQFSLARRSLGGISGHETSEFRQLRTCMALNVKRPRMEGLIATDYEKRFQEAARIITDRLAHGRLKRREDIAVGPENAPKTLLQMFRGEKFGRQILKIAGTPLPISKQANCNSGLPCLSIGVRAHNSFLPYASIHSSYGEVYCL